MGFKARELEGMTKAELIKALRASAALEAKLHKRIAKLSDQVAELEQIAADYMPAAPANAPTKYDVVHVTQGEDTVSELTPQDAEAHAPAGVARDAPAGRQRRRIDAAKSGTLEPVFPWEKK